MPIPTTIGGLYATQQRISVCEATGALYTIRFSDDTDNTTASMAVYNSSGTQIAASGSLDDIWGDVRYSPNFCVLDNGKIIVSRGGSVKLFNADFTGGNTLYLPGTGSMENLMAVGNVLHVLVYDSVTPANGLVQIHTADCSAGTLPESWASTISLQGNYGSGYAGNFTGFDTDSSGNYYVACYSGDIFKYTPAGAASYFSTDPAVFTNGKKPWIITVLGNKLYMTTSNTSEAEIMAMNLDGSSQEVYYRSVTPDAWPEGIASHSNGSLYLAFCAYVAPSYECQIYKFVVAMGVATLDITPTVVNGKSNIAFSNRTGATKYSIHVNSKPVKLINDGSTFSTDLSTKKGNKSLATIVAKDGSGNIVDTTTVLLGAIPAAITGAKLLSQTASTATLMWSRLNNNIEALSGIRVYIKNMGTSAEVYAEFAMEELPTDKTVVVTGLTASVLYNMKIRAYNTLGESDDSAIVVVQM